MFASFVIAALAALQGDAGPEPAPTIEPVAAQVWMHTSYRHVEPWGLVRSNGLVVETPAGLVLIDSAWTNDQTRALLDLVQAELGQPVTHAVFTHAHEDRMGGAEALREAGIVTYATDLTNSYAIAAGRGAATHSLSLNVGDMSEALAGLDIFYPGPGHTPDNIVVRIEASGVIFGGCLIRPARSLNLGNTAQADVEAWADTVERVAAQFPDSGIVIPSHGPPGGRNLLDLTIALARPAPD